MSNQKPITTIFLESIVATMMVGGVFLVVLNPTYSIFKFGTNYAVQIMFGYFLASIGFLFIKKPELLFTGFACTAALCIFLQQSSNKDLVFPEINGEEKISVAQFNMPAASDDPIASIKTILETNADIISLQEVTPDWQSLLKAKLTETYPYFSLVFRPEDFLGVAMLSKLPFERIDTVYANHVPNLIAKIKLEGRPIFLASTYFYPELDENDVKLLAEHKALINNYFESVSDPILNFGEFNQVQWASFISDYKFSMNLKDSRRFPFFDNPTDHIFFSDHFDCLDFKTISNAYTNHLGISGVYQIKMNLANVEKANR